jgi:hypothetical protein
MSSNVPVSISEGTKGDFDFIFYASNNADIAIAIGSDDQDALWAHFVNFGRFENRTHRFTSAISINGSGTEINGNILVFDSSVGAWEPSNSLATALATTGDAVNVSSANAPSADQVLTATSATTVTWQTPASSYGREFRSATGGPATVTNATTTFEEALSISNATTPAGTYKVSWCAEWTLNTAVSSGEIRVSMTGADTTIIGLEILEPTDTSNTHMTSGYRFITLTNASHGVIMEFRTDLSGTVSVTRRSLEIIRVA